MRARSGPGLDLARVRWGPGPGPAYGDPDLGVRVQVRQKGSGPDLDRTSDSLIETVMDGVKERDETMKTCNNNNNKQNNIVSQISEDF